MAYTTTDFIADVQRSGMLPSSAPLGLADADILAHGTKELRTFIYPALKNAREEYYINEYRVSVLSPAATPGSAASAIKIPSRAVAGSIRDVWYLRSSVRTNLTRIDPERLPNIKYNQSTAGEPWGFYVQSNALYLIPSATNITSGYSISCMTRPGMLIPAAAPAFQATAITATGSAGIFIFTFGSTHSFVTGQKVDLIDNNSPYGYRLVDATATFDSSTSIQVNVNLGSPFDGTTPANEVGIWVTPSDQSPVVQCPDELYHVCVQATVARCLQATGFIEEAQEARADASRMLSEAMVFLSPRIEGEERKVVGSMMWRGRLGPIGWGW